MNKDNFLAYFKLKANDFFQDRVAFAEINNKMTKQQHDIFILNTNGMRMEVYDIKSVNALTRLLLDRGGISTNDLIKVLGFTSELMRFDTDLLADIYISDNNILDNKEVNRILNHNRDVCEQAIKEAHNEIREIQGILHPVYNLYTYQVNYIQGTIAHNEKKQKELTILAQTAEDKSLFDESDAYQEQLKLIKNDSKNFRIGLMRHYRYDPHLNDDAIDDLKVLSHRIEYCHTLASDLTAQSGNKDETKYWADKAETIWKRMKFIKEGKPSEKDIMWHEISEQKANKQQEELELENERQKW